MQLQKNRNLQFKKERKARRVSMEEKALPKVLPQLVNSRNKPETL